MSLPKIYKYITGKISGLNLIEPHKESPILFLPILFCLGIIIFKICHNCRIANNIATINWGVLLHFSILATFSLIAFFIVKNQNRILAAIYIASFLIIIGFIWSFIYHNYLFPINIIKYRTYGNIIGQITDIKYYHNPINNKKGTSLVIENIDFYRTKNINKREIHKDQNIKKKIHRKIGKNAKKSSRIKDKITKNQANNKKITKEQQKQEQKIIDCNNDVNCIDSLKKDFAIRKEIKDIRKLLFQQKTLLLQDPANNMIATKIKNLEIEIINLKWRIKIPKKWQKELDKCNNEDNPTDKISKNTPNNQQKIDDLTNNCNLLVKEKYQNSEYQKIINKKYHKERNEEINNNNIELPDQINEINDPINKSQPLNIIEEPLAMVKMPKMTNKFNRKAIKCYQDYRCLIKVKEEFNNQKEQKEQEKKFKIEQKKLLAIKKKQEKRREKLIKKARKKFINFSDIQDYDRKFIDLNNNYQYFQYDKININNSKLFNFTSKITNELAINSPRKIRLITNNDAAVNIGDIIHSKVMINKNNSKSFIGDFDYANDALIKSIAGSGFAIGNIEILNKNKSNALKINITKLRYHIFNKINELIDNKDEAKILAALLVGTQNLIPQDIMKNIQNSGLVHLLSISGLHLSLVAGMFFVVSYFLFTRNENLALNYNLRKFSAFFAIIASFFYLQLAGSPIPAIRAFIGCFLIFLAIIIDRKSDPLRIVATALLIIVIINSDNLFSVSMQLSFVAITSLIISAKWIEKAKPLNIKYNLFAKIWWYILQIILSSIFIQIAILPFTAYHFNNFNIIGILANLIAIPITSFITMTTGFIGLLFIFINDYLANFILEISAFSIRIIIVTAKFFASLPYSKINVGEISSKIFFISSFSFILFAIITSRIRYIFLVILLITNLVIINVKVPNLLIDGKQKFFALYHPKLGLFFSEEINNSKKLNLWLENVNFNGSKANYYNIAILPNIVRTNCNNDFCLINLTKFNNLSSIDKSNIEQYSSNDKLFLIINHRSKINDLCIISDFYNIEKIINLTKKFAIPDCIINNQKYHNKIIDNIDFISGKAILIT